MLEVFFRFCSFVFLIGVSAFEYLLCSCAVGFSSVCLPPCVCSVHFCFPANTLAVLFWQSFVSWCVYIVFIFPLSLLVLSSSAPARCVLSVCGFLI